MLVELQFRAERFFPFIRARLRAELVRGVCITGAFPFEGRTFLVDFLEIPAITFLTRRNRDVTVNLTGTAPPLTFPAPQVRVHQRLYVRLTTEEALLRTRRGNRPEPLTDAPNALSFDLVFWLQVTVTAGAPELVLTYDDLVPADPITRMIPEAELARIRDEVRMRAPAQRFPIDLRELTNLLGAQVVNAGAAAPGPTTWLAIAVELERAATIPLPSGFADAPRTLLWTSFYENGSTTTDDRLGADDWALFISEPLLLDGVAEVLRNSLGTSSQLTLANDVPIGVTWRPAADGGTVSVHLEGWVNPSECVCGLRVYVDIETRIDTLAPGSLHLAIHVGWAVNAFHVVACCIAPLAISPGYAITSAFIQGRPWAVGLIFAPVLLPILGAFVAAFTYSPGALPGPGRCTQLSDHDLDCEVPASVNFAGLPRLELTATRGSALGLVLAGTMEAVADATITGVEATLLSDALQWSITGTCLRPDPIAAVARITIRNAGTTVMRICSVEPRTAPYRPRHLTVTPALLGSGQRTTLTVRVPPEDVVEPGRDCELFIRTTSGIRYVRLQAPPPFSPELRDQIEQANVIRCSGLRSDLLSRGVMELTRPLDDPPLRVSVVARGLRRGDTIRMLDANDQTVASATRDPHGVARLTALLTEPQPGAPRLEIVRNRSLFARLVAWLLRFFGWASAEPAVGVSVQRLQRSAELAFPAPILEAGELLSDNRLYLAVATSLGVGFYERAKDGSVSFSHHQPLQGLPETIPHPAGTWVVDPDRHRIALYTVVDEASPL